MVTTIGLRRKTVVKIRRAFLIAVVVISVGMATVLISVETLPGASIRANPLPPPPGSSKAPGLVVDPTVMRADPAVTWDPEYRVYRMYTTETWSGHVPEWQSANVTGPWRYVGDALPELPAWHGEAFTTWKPAVQFVDGVWTLWGSTADRQGNYCLYRATAKTAGGPFTVDPRRVPCDTDVNGDIDPSPVKVSGQWWLLEKSNGIAVGKPTTFLSQRLGPDGMPFGSRFTLLVSDQPWEVGQIEAPNFIQNPTTKQWWLVFSAGGIDLKNPSYQIYTTPCDGPQGPCHIGSVVKLVSRNAQGMAPGEQNAFDASDGQAWIAYNPGAYFAPPLNRPLALVKLDFNDRGVPYVVTP